MVYKKYIKRNGKTYGPYYCESYRHKGKIKTRFVSGPKKRHKVVRKFKKKVGNFKKNRTSKKLSLIFGVVFVMFFILLIGNLNYSKLSGNVVYDEELVSSSETRLAEQIAQGLESNVEIGDHVVSEVKQPVFETNKILEFDVSKGKIELAFDLLNYSQFVEKDIEEEVEAENFDIKVEKHSKKYKWSYDIKLNDLNFIAKVDVKTDKEIKIIDNQTLKIGKSYLSFADLIEQGYILTMNKPVVLDEIIEEVNITEEEINETQEMNLTQTNETEINITIPENETEINITIPEEESISEEITEEPETNITEEPEVVEEQETNETQEPGVFEESESEEEITDESEDIEELEENESKDIVEQPNEETKEEHNLKEDIETRDESKKPSDVLDKEKKQEKPEKLEKEKKEKKEKIEPVEITGAVIKTITGFFVRGAKGITGFATQEQENIVSIYIEKDFKKYNKQINSQLINNNSNNLSSIREELIEIKYQDIDNSEDISVGDLITLDPTLIIIEIIKAQHLDENYVFFSDIYEQVKTQDNVWTETIPNNHYVRVKFEQNLTNEKDITIYARSITNQTSEIEVYRKDNNQMITKFENISNESLYKVYLNNLSENESRNVFDLKVIGGVEFDYIVDPVIAYNGSNIVYRCGLINVSGTYTMNQSIVNNSLTTPCINITIPNVILDCSSYGYYISSDDYEIGIYSNSTNTTIRGCNISVGLNPTCCAFSYGIYLSGANNSYIWNNTFNSQNVGLYMNSTNSTTIENNTANSNWMGIWANLGSKNIIINNTANSNLDYGIYLVSSDNNTLTGNNASLNEDDGIYLASSSNNTLTNNVANSGGWRGIYLSSSSDNNLTNNTANSNRFGIYLFNSSSNNIINNTSNLNAGFATGNGIILDSSSNNTLTSNNLTNNNNDAMSLSSSLNNIITNTTINSNWNGIYLASSSNNTLTNNNLWNCTYVCVSLNTGSNNNTFSEGIINWSANNLIYFDSSSDNNIFRDMELINSTGNDTFLTGTSINNTFINVTYNKSKEYVEAGSELIRKWYYRAYVNDLDGNDFSSANFTAFNSSGDYQFNLTTNSTGWINTTTIIDYVNNGSINYYSPHNLYARNASLSSANHSYNITLYENNLTDAFTIDNEVPVVTLISPVGTTTTTSVPYKYNVTDSSNITSCSLVLDGVAVSTDTSITNGTEQTITYTTSAGTHIYSVNCTDEATNTGSSGSNNLIVVVSTTTVTTGGGGGGGTRTISLNIDTLPALFLYEAGQIEIPVTLLNDGQINFNEVSLTGVVLEDGEETDINVEFSKDSFRTIETGASEELTLTADLSVEDIDKQILITATSRTPSYTTSETVNLDFVGEDESEVNKMIAFVENMVVENPECLELKEMINEATNAFKQGDFNQAILKSNNAVEACRKSISGPSKAIYPSLKGELNKNILFYLVIGIIVAIVFAVVFNLYKKYRFREKGG